MNPAPGLDGWQFDAKRDPSFAFLEEPHEYRLGDRRLWSPSAVFRQVGYVEDFYYTDAARHRGSYVHWITRLSDENDLDLNDVAPEYLPYHEAYREFVRVWKFVPLLTERPIYHASMLYGVTPDRVGLIHGGDPAVVELKTGSMPWWAAIQAAAQDDAVQSWMQSPRFHRRIVVQLRKNGRFVARECDDPDDYDVWRAALKTCQRIGDPPLRVQLPPGGALLNV